MRLVISLDDSIFVAGSERPDAATQRWHVRHAAACLAPVLDAHEVVLCHGNAAELSTLAVQSENDDRLTRPFPLDAVAAQTQGVLGYWLVDELRRAAVVRPVAALVTQTVTDPTRRTGRTFVGPPYTRQQIQLWAGELGWRFGDDHGSWRRVVPSLEPLAVVEADTVAALLSSGTTVVCGGGGGVPVSADPAGDHEPIDAVIEPDLTAARLAIDLQADRLLLVSSAFDGPSFAAGDSRGPDAASRAARWFVEATGRPASLGGVHQVADMLGGRCEHARSAAS